MSIPSDESKGKVLVVTENVNRVELETLRRSIALLPVPASAVDLESNRIIALNAQFAQSLRLPLETILDRTPDELGFRSNSDDRKAVLEGTTNGRIHHTHRRTKLPDGNWVEYTDSSHRILVDNRECLFSCYEPASRLVSEATTIRKVKELELERSEERLRLVLDATSDGVFDWDIPSGKVYFSPAYFTMLGYEPFEFPSTFDAWRERLHPDDLFVVEPAIQAHLSNQERTPYLVEFRMRHKQGRWTWILAKGRVVSSDTDGKPVRMVGTHSDITDRKQQENALREREEQLRIVADMSLDMLSRHDLSGICTWASPACRQILHIEPEAVVGRSAFDFIYEEWHRPVQAALAKLVEIGRSSLEYRILRSDGTGIWAETLWNLSRDAQGNPLEILCSTRDITDRKRQEEILRDSEYFFKESQRASSTGSYRLHLETGFWDYSETMGEILGIDRSFVSNVEGWLNMIHPDDQEAMRRHFLEDVIDSRGAFNKEYRIVRPCDGEIRWVHGLGELVLDSAGNPLHMIGTLRDVTDRHKAEAEIKLLNGNLERKVEERTTELRTAMQELESFSYSISHDLRSPLRAIDGFSKALVEDAGPGLPEDLQMYLGRIRAASKHMGQLIDDLLQLSRSSRMEIVRRDIDISSIATQILDDLCRQSPHRRLERRIESSISIQGDTVLVRSVLENLLGNAWKYSSLKSESVIELSAEVRDGRRWISIRDNGIGFDMAHANKLFGTFHRLHSLEQFEGTGIGLATVRKIVERHGGSVTGSGIPEKGADFRFTLDPEKGAPA